MGTPRFFAGPDPAGQKGVFRLVQAPADASPILVHQGLIELRPLAAANLSLAVLSAQG